MIAGKIKANHSILVCVLVEQRSEKEPDWHLSLLNRKATSWVITYPSSVRAKSDRLFKIKTDLCFTIVIISLDLSRWFHNFANQFLTDFFLKY